MKRAMIAAALAASLASLSCHAAAAQPAQTWTADNGNGTFTNPLFYDEFSDPDLIRVGDDYYMTGTTMHTMPGLPILHSKDLVNWAFVAYAVDKLDLGPAFRLEDGKAVYGQGIWAPSLRYHDGTFYIFSNINGYKTQILSATDPKGPWTRREMKVSLHDLSVLFDEGKAYAVWGYQGIRMAQLTPDLTDLVPGTEREIIPASAGMGEGLHIYRFGGKYFITSAWFAGRMRMPAARSDSLWGPYEVNPAISADEDYGLAEGHRLNDMWAGADSGPYAINPPNVDASGHLSLHQGGIVDTPQGEWWGFSMMDANAVGRLVNLSPVTWQDGWPYFGLPGNLIRTPRTWVKPKTQTPQAIHVPYERSDDFSGSGLKPIWQWNHVPVDGKWSLSERKGFLRLHALPADSLWRARNSLTQRAIGPMSSPSVVIDASHLKSGDVAGLALFNRPYAWIGVEKTATGLNVTHYDQQTGKTTRAAIAGPRLTLRADCDFMTEIARFSYSTDGVHFTPIGDAFTMVFQLKTFQGVRYSLFSYTTQGKPGGYADFDSFQVDEPHPNGLMRPIPYGRQVTLTAFAGQGGLSLANGQVVRGTPSRFDIIDLGLGRAALKSGDTYVTVAADGHVSLTKGAPGAGQSFQWIETPTGELVLMSLATNRFLRIDPASGAVMADSPGPQPNGKDGVRFVWSE